MDSLFDENDKAINNLTEKKLRKYRKQSDRVQMNVKAPFNALTTEGIHHILGRWVMYSPMATAGPINLDGGLPVLVLIQWGQTALTVGGMYLGLSFVPGWKPGKMINKGLL